MTIRENTERPITVEVGTNTLAGNKKDDILRCYNKIIKTGKQGSVATMWDGRVVERIVDILIKTQKKN